MFKLCCILCKNTLSVYILGICLVDRVCIKMFFYCHTHKKEYYRIIITSECWKQTLSSFNMIIIILAIVHQEGVVTCFRMRSNMRMKQPRFMSSSSQSRSRAQWPVAWPRFLKGLQRRGLRNGLLKGLGKGLRVLCCPRRPGSDTTLTYEQRAHHHIK